VRWVPLAAVVSAVAAVPDAAVQPGAKVAGCLRAAGRHVQLESRRGDPFVIASHGLTSWTIDVGRAKPTAAWTGYRRGPTAAEQRVLRRCLAS